MRILVTGGGGFIGSHLVDALIKKGHRVVIIDNLSTGQKRNINPRAKFYKIDIRSSKIETIFKKEKPQIVYHCAAQINLRKSIEDPVYDADVNIRGSLNILQNFVRFCQGYGGRIRISPRLSSPQSAFIFSSTGGAIYGETKKIPTPETEPARPTSPYGLNKLTFEKFLEIYRQLYGLNYVALRYANVYGPRQNTKAEAGVIAIFITQLLKGERPKINGSGRQTRDYIYIGDVVKANLLFLSHKNTSLIRTNWGSRIFNVGTGKETSVNEIFQKISNSLKGFVIRRAKPLHGPAISGELMRSALDCRKIKKFGWQPQVSLDEGLIKTIRWFKRII